MTITSAKAPSLVLLLSTLHLTGRYFNPESFAEKIIMYHLIDVSMKPSTFEDSEIAESHI